jgi:sulfate adenylyltransferase
VIESLAIDRRSALELHKLAIGAYAPLTGFMVEAEVDAVVDSLRLPDGRPFPLPVVLELPAPEGVRPGDRPVLTCDGAKAGDIEVASVFRLDLAATAERLFGTRDPAHPGARAWQRAGGWFVGGPVTMAAGGPAVPEWPEPTPAEMRALFASRGWRSVVAFNTRNIPHRAHEYLHRQALEMADALLIHPIVGPRKRGDYTTEAILTSYRAYIDRFLPSDRVVLAPLAVPMRYAGPREAVLHALIRANYGATHLIVGRDHAGVGEWYGQYDAQALAREFGPELGIEIVAAAGPFYCRICDGIVTERTCPHRESAPEAVSEVSGSAIRAVLTTAGKPRPELIRPEVVASLAGLAPFIEADQ